jgi:hypothetical protein
MATNFPTSLDALTNPSAGNTLNSPSHSTQHANSNDAIEALQAKVGVNSSAVTSSLDYKITNINADNLTSGNVPGSRINGSYTGIVGVGTLAAGSIPTSLLTGTFPSSSITGLATSATTDTTNANNITTGLVGGGRLNGIYSGITGIGTQTVQIIATDIFPDSNNNRYCGGYSPAWAFVGSYNFYNPSDIRYKKNVVDLPLGVDFLKLINPIEFTYVYPQFETGTQNVTSSTEGSRLRAGLSAQNVHEALTTFGAGDYNFWALGDKDDVNSMQVLDYTGFIAPLIQAVKELDKRLAEVEQA